MENEEIMEQETNTQEPELNPIEEIQKLKQNYVPKDAYEKVVREKNDYFKALVNGESLSGEKPEPVNIDAIRKELFSQDTTLTNLDFAEKALKLREAIIDQEGKDIFVPQGHSVIPTDEDYMCAEKVANGLAHCCEVAQGNPDIFRTELLRITADTTLQRPGVNSKIRR